MSRNQFNNLRTITTWQFVDNLSIVHNAHTFEFGINLRFQKHVDDRSAVRVSTA
jgi:hypothetical protein